MAELAAELAGKFLQRLFHLRLIGDRDNLKRKLPQLGQASK